MVHDNTYSPGLLPTKHMYPKSHLNRGCFITWGSRVPDVGSRPSGDDAVVPSQEMGTPSCCTAISFWRFDFPISGACLHVPRLANQADRAQTVTVHQKPAHRPASPQPGTRTAQG